MTPPRLTTWREAAEVFRLPRVQSRIERTESCWLWTGTRSIGGYAVIAQKRERKSRTFYVHRIAYAAYYREDIPAGMVCDHLCRVRHCVNPSHIEVVTQQVNLRRGLRSGLKETCANGHPWAEVRHFRGGSFRCSVCVKEQNDRNTRLLAEAARAAGLTQQEFRERYGRRLKVLSAWVLA